MYWNNHVYSLNTRHTMYISGYYLTKWFLFLLFSLDVVIVLVKKGFIEFER